MTYKTRVQKIPTDSKNCFLAVVGGLVLVKGTAKKVIFSVCWKGGIECF